ncbi:DinB family protein [Allobranchiibius sp. CTAmp26]|uniref:DinB family protein n=1 Tax=Allobranchiibius sp. CTAmp26 TaxID=2815214 RepID=UPI001AA10DA2|nr:DinB family protein [Allobranchiibius sp. CTAmp26]MBO1754640.1 DinB family protein [Allobranchiibius sp. CTAmp26]
MDSSRDDVLELADHVWARFTVRMSELGDEEWAWCPTPDDRISIRWRVQHVTEVLGEQRNGVWLGLEAPATASRPSPTGAVAAMAAANEAFTRWRALVVRDEVVLSAPVGATAGDHGEATRRSYVLHVIDELAHHCAEITLLRSLYECRQRAPILPTFAAVIGHGPAWDDDLDPRHQTGWEAHAKYTDGLVADGTIALGGPLEDGGEIVHLVTAPDEASLRRRLGDDPWHRGGLLRIDRVQRCHLWLDGRA